MIQSQGKILIIRSPFTILPRVLYTHVALKTCFSTILFFSLFWKKNIHLQDELIIFTMKRITNTRNCSPTPLRHSGLTPSRQRKEMQTLLKVYPLSFSGKCIFTVRLASRPCDTRKHRSLSLSLSLTFPLSLFRVTNMIGEEKARGDRLCVCRGRAVSDQCHGTA